MNQEKSTVQIDKLKSGDEESFAMLVDETSGKIYRTLLQILGNEQDAEDILQETYLKAYRAIPEFENRSGLYTWLHRIALNEALMQIRIRKPQIVSIDDNEPFSDDLDIEQKDIVDFCCLPEGELLSKESRHFLDQAVQTLPESLRIVFVMRDIEGLSTQETADALQISENNVKIRLMRARMILRKKLSAYFNKFFIEEKEL
ncbi:sigma-70 family RNA polymerase sigma factor [Flexilinea flocculi]|jgi:RNA polymerase sigma-70 factor (ECF subfamily)|uniref:RNA polymerase sigma factor n=1 Tax=Flexilinea flocculi TaxID=1678840 RepID=A0A0S7BN85_9CHLR|nr:sigma-70 family RNA polymerase sigma factor [Flexilinea flocculi]NMB93612.1 sigma-70 family RNA polymerase sigma factor [Flexilinea flocculi]GAP41629.1 RNA polymerase sigma factor, sigma-70 family [Flexilinea flocculi]